MSDYTQITDFSAKDALASGDPEKVATGADVDAELAAISTAIATKANDSAVVHDTGDETIAGTKTFSDAVAVGGAVTVGTTLGVTGAATLSGAASVGGALSAAGTVAFSGDISPSQITSDQDNYAPTGIATAAVLRLTSDALRYITGITTGADGRLLTLINVGSFNIGLKTDTTSTAANRFYFENATVFVLNPKASITLMYDATSSRWRPLNASRQFFESSEQTVASNTDTAVAHSLGVVPSRTSAVLRCKTTEHGYAVGDEAPILMTRMATNNFSSPGLYANATNVGFVSGAAFTIVSRSSTGADASVTLGNWALVLRAWA